MTYQFTPLPEPGDIVWCYFPHQEDAGAPGPKERPALVIRVSEADHAVQVAYGTSKRTHQIHKGEFVMDPADGGFQISGLSVRTKFDLNRREQLYFDAEYFAPAPGVHTQSPLPKMGTMHSSYYAELQKAASQIT
ncbi:hypothetical protein [Pseudomonas sp. PS01301]|uniref:hypothetical protein n=1 Tax=Pseudomonas sp. PS01301 TaxID=2991437 RepID=UPI00249CB1C3|nr:hypothetical protein [Pseudomonas sp. PS01301]